MKLVKSSNLQPIDSDVEVYYTSDMGKRNKIQVECKVCGKSYETVRSPSNRKVTCGDIKCVKQLHSQRMLGNKNWQHPNVKLFQKGHEVSDATRLAVTLSNKNRIPWNKGKVKLRKITTQGYILIYKPNHPNSNLKGFILEHRYVMSENLDRPLTANEIVHHKNAKKDDNRLKNLEIIYSKNLSNKFHKGQLDCPYCGKSFSIK